MPIPAAGVEASRFLAYVGIGGYEIPGGQVGPGTLHYALLKKLVVKDKPAASGVGWAAMKLYTLNAGQLV